MSPEGTSIVPSPPWNSNAPCTLTLKLPGHSLVPGRPSWVLNVHTQAESTKSCYEFTIRSLLVLNCKNVLFRRRCWPPPGTAPLCLASSSVCLEAASAPTATGSPLQSHSCQRLPECFVRRPLPTPAVADVGPAIVHRVSLTLRLGDLTAVMSCITQKKAPRGPESHSSVLFFHISWWKEALGTAFAKHAAGSPSWNCLSCLPF